MSAETLRDLVGFLQEWAPLSLAESWDNVGLLVGDPGAPIRRAMVCLSVTPSSVAEAVEGRADLIVSHHPFPFRPIQRVILDTVVGRLLARLLQAGIAVYSPHTAFDSAPRGINQQLAEGLKLVNIQPIVPAEGGPPAAGTGRMGFTTDAPSLHDVARRVRSFLGTDRVDIVGIADQTIQHVAVACGSAAPLLEPAARAGCDCLVMGEARFHACLQAEALGMGLILAGHFASEQFALPSLAHAISQRFPRLHVWTCQSEADPVRPL